jgi:S-DNA-T family DNA segregation ATPase FtsK/SpoIIIE
VGYALLILDLARFVFDTLFLLGRAAWDHPGRAAFVVAFGGLAVLFGFYTAVAVALDLIVAAVVLRWVRKRWWFRLVGWWWRPAWRRFWSYERKWRSVMKMCWLSSIVDNGLDVFPLIHKVSVGAFGDVVLVRVLIGQKLPDWEDKVDELATAWGAQSVRAFPHYRDKARLRLALLEGAEGSRRRVRVVVQRDGPKRVPGIVRLEVAVRDPLSVDVPAVPIPATSAEIRYEAIPVGLTENGTAWTLKVRGAHILIAGLTGSGKGSVFWSILKGLAPGIRDGIVEVWAIDPKGGMELYTGRPLFTRYCDSSEAAMVQLLAHGVTTIDRRTQRLKGATRNHTPTREEPLIVIFVDEFASLMVAKSTSKEDRAVAEEAKAAATLIVNKGRAVGVVLIGALQNPRKQVVDMRDEFPERVAMRLLSADYTDMMFYRGAARSGIRCDLILRSLPGTGYAWSDDARAVVRVRAAYVDDDEIHALALEYQPPKGPTTITDDELAEWLDKISRETHIDDVLHEIEAGADVEAGESSE